MYDATDKQMTMKIINPLLLSLEVSFLQPNTVWNKLYIIHMLSKDNKEARKLRDNQLLSLFNKLKITHFWSFKEGFSTTTKTKLWLYRKVDFNGVSVLYVK